MDDHGAPFARAEQLARGRRPGALVVEIVTPARDASSTTHTLVDIVTDEMPFVADSVTAHLARRGFEVHRVDEQHGEGVTLVHAEIDRETDPGVLARLRVEVEDVLEDVEAAVADWRPMTERVLELAAALRSTPPPTVDPADRLEAAEFLEWLADDRFTFVGSSVYDIVGSGEDAHLRPDPVAMLGVARRRPLRDPGSHGSALLAPYVLTMTKADDRSTVHRATSLDDVRVRRFDADGRATEEVRFVGLFTAPVYTDSVTRIPVLRRKVAAVLQRADIHTDARTVSTLGDGRLMNVLETLPRELLFRLGVDELDDLVHGVADVGERRRVRLFSSPDELGRFVTCLVYLPRDRYTTRVRSAIVDALRDAYHAADADFSVLVSESVMARLQVFLDLHEGARALTPAVDLGALERRLVELVRAWTDDLRDALQEVHGEEGGLDAFRVWGNAFPAAYHADVSPRDAVDDIAALSALDPAGDLAIRLVRGRHDHDGVAHLVLYRSGTPLVLSDVMPVLDELDVVVVDEHPYEVVPGPGGTAGWIYAFGVHAVSGARLDTPVLQRRIADLFLGVWRGAIENDGLNRLVVAAGLDPADVVILRSFTKYLLQVGERFTEATLASTLVANPVPARGIVDLFHARLDPSCEASNDVREVDAQLERDIDAVAELDDDRVLRALAALARAAVRTNAFFVDRAVEDRLAIKFDPAALAFLPSPRPAHEIWVYSPRFEGVHLRGGDVARGGIRWSDRRDDFRTEVLGLMKAQTAKNSVIVPVGAKGGFVVKRAGSIPERDALRAEVLECYRSFVRGLLDLTDNRADGEVVPLAPTRLVRLDGEDPYLVVAADKGTATFSDAANALAAEYGYWLDDAFASGGSRGYDHKAMGITARGAWVSVQSHFRALGIDADAAPLTVVGIGDMSGDVFGNGLLRSPHVHLVAAFDHRHVFVDPSPDPAASFAERRRLFDLPGSSWADYDPALLSPGGGVFSRTAKSIVLSPEARGVLGLADANSALTPDELVSAVLRAPADLLWNGGVGTFVKASSESNDDVGDRSNDGLRVDAAQLRVRVVAEGGNLGLTQAARVEFVVAGGRVYSDAIDNSAGVDCSDHEVNIKILLREAIRRGELAADARDPLLAQMTDEVASLVLADNVAQANALEIASVEAPDLLGVHARQIERLEQGGLLDRALEGLPDVKGLQERGAAHRGLTAPELAVLLAFTKIDLQRQLVHSDVPDDSYLVDDLLAYFPTPLRERFAGVATEHPLRREIVATVVANAVVNRAGISFLSRLADELGAPIPELARAHVIARDVLDARVMWDAIDALDYVVAPETQTTMFLALRRLVERSARWFVRHAAHLPVGPDGSGSAIASVVAEFRPPVGTVLTSLADLLDTDEANALRVRTDELERLGVPAPLAVRVAGCDAALGALTIADIARVSDLNVRDVARVHYALGARLGLVWLREQVAALPRGDRWQTEARAALRDDVADCHRALTESVCASGAADVTGVDAWLDAHTDDVDRYRRVVDEVQFGGNGDLAQLTAARRALRDLCDAVAEAK